MATSVEIIVTVRAIPGTARLVAILYPIIGQERVYRLLEWLVWYRIEKGRWTRLRSIEQ